MEGAARAGGAMILVVDRNPRNLDLLAEVLDKHGYQTARAASLEEFDQALADPAAIRLALVDIAGFDPSIWPRCERTREAGIPLLVISPRQSASIQQESLARGARGVLIKPLAVRELLGMVAALLRE